MTLRSSKPDLWKLLKGNLNKGNTINNGSFSSKRVVSIDVFRALTMFLMIFVNDFWTLTNVPEWLKHKAAQVDGIGFSDIIFPAFLFIVGLSIPYAITSRRQKQESHSTIVKHVFKRTLALVIMGVFMVNFEYINAQALIINKHLWEIIMVIAIFLVWLYYKPFQQIGTKQIVALQILGVTLFIFLAVVYRGGSANQMEWMKTHWWGILGIIGWAYLFNTLIYLYFGKNVIYLILTFIVFQLLNIQEFTALTSMPALKLVVSASMHASVAAGMLVGSLLLRYQKQNKEHFFIAALAVLGTLSLLYGFAMREYWGGFSKIRATPSWTSVCIGISVFSFLILYLVVDKLKLKSWAKPIKIAGTNTLTCYVMPYLIYPIMVWTGTVELLERVSNGYLGLLKSLLFSFIIIGIVSLLDTLKVKLKL
ncbi:heparan-alpha-glucosaminide N-acetyltransferase domain-containing protein [Aestuariivivens sediminis]|uniref:heparan-alpha-glucosaminide N-acetyltransferase domain-containing protein n=1 Tax=Aestuariivivens sediminis TaxID=2913557 RepID=UPI001F5837EE|nr:DUF5009 domain-containing protein [Aestuariivivens sediminis]